MTATGLPGKGHIIPIRRKFGVFWPIVISEFTSIPLNDQLQLSPRKGFHCIALFNQQYASKLKYFAKYFFFYNKNRNKFVSAGSLLPVWISMSISLQNNLTFLFAFFLASMRTQWGEEGEHFLYCSVKLVGKEGGKYPRLLIQPSSQYFLKNQWRRT